MDRLTKDDRSEMFEFGNPLPPDMLFEGLELL